MTDYLVAAGLMPYLEALRFHLVGYGCTTCIGNSGPLDDHIAKAVADGDLSVAAVLSGNRNFEGRIHSAVRANYLASPPLVIAYALAGSVTIDLSCEPIGTGADGQAVYLNDLLPDPGEVAQLVASYVTPSAFVRSYADIFQETISGTAWKCRLVGCTSGRKALPTSRNRHSLAICRNSPLR